MESDDIPIEVLREGARLWEQGKHYESISENRKAIECYQEMMRLSFPDPVVLNCIGYCYLLLNETDKCKETLKQALDLDPKNEEALHNLSMIMYDTGEFEEAEDLTRRGIGVKRSFAGNWHNLGKVFYVTDRLEDAQETLATAIGLEPDRADTHYFMGLTLDKMDEEDKAHRSFLRAVELEDDNVQYLMGYGRFLLNLKQPVDAEKYLRKAVEVEDVNHRALSILAECLIDQTIALKENAPENLVGDAMELLNRSLDLDLSYGMSWFQWGRVWMLINDWEKAEEPLRNAIENDCEDPMAWAHLSFVLKQIGREHEADEMFEEYRIKSGQKEEEE
jgi:Tfp pilus assembly protein PilF